MDKEPTITEQQQRVDRFVRERLDLSHFDNDRHIREADLIAEYQKWHSERHGIGVYHVHARHDLSVVLKRLGCHRSRDVEGGVIHQVWSGLAWKQPADKPQVSLYSPEPQEAMPRPAQDNRMPATDNPDGNQDTKDKAEQDSVNVFIKECLLFDYSLSIAKSVLTDAYQQWCRDKNFVWNEKLLLDTLLGNSTVDYGQEGNFYGFALQDGVKDQAPLIPDKTQMSDLDSAIQKSCNELMELLSEKEEWCVSDEPPETADRIRQYYFLRRRAVLVILNGCFVNRSWEES